MPEKSYTDIGIFTSSQKQIQPCIGSPASGPTAQYGGQQLMSF
jgi:hypothetical protein